MTMTITKLLAAVAVASSTLVAAPTLGHSRGWHGYHGDVHGHRGCYGGDVYYGYAYGGAYGYAPRGYGCW